MESPNVKPFKEAEINIHLLLHEQTSKMCEALQLLHSRCESGQETAIIIWKCLVDAITEVPSCFSSGDLEHFCKPEEFPVKDIVLRHLIYEALGERAKRFNKNAQVHPTDNEIRSMCVFEYESTTFASKLDCFEDHLPCYRSEASSGENFFQYMLSILKVIAARTNNLGIWKTGDGEFEREMNMFNKSVILSVAVIEQLIDMEKPNEIDRLSDAMINKATLEPSHVKPGTCPKDSFCDVKIPDKANSNSRVIRQNRVIGMIEQHSHHPVGILPDGFCDHAGYIQPFYHQRDFKRDNLRCVCGQQFKSLVLLDKHVRLMNEPRMIICDFCCFQTSKTCCMDKHVTIQHAEMKSNHRLYQCQYGCKTLFMRKNELRLHQSETKHACKYSDADQLPIQKKPPKNFEDLLTKAITGTAMLSTPSSGPTPTPQQLIDDGIKLLEEIAKDNPAYCHKVVKKFFQKKPRPSKSRRSNNIAKVDKKEDDNVK